MNKFPSVVHLVPSLFGTDGGVVGGAERYALELARHMAVETPTAVVSFGDHDREETLGRLRVRVIGKPWHVRGQRFNPVSAKVFPELMKADVVHCHQQHVLTSSLVAALCRAIGRRVFVTDLGGGGWDISAYMSTDRWYRGHLHISEYSRGIYGHQDRPWAHVISGGVDAVRFSPGNYPVKSGCPALFVGRLLPHKGVNDFIAAAPPDMPVEIIGQPYDPRFVADLERLARGKQVRFRHDCDDAALVEAYRRAICIVLPSVYRTMYGEESRVPELLGQTLLEGMACGTPAICTNVASMPEIVEDGVTGFIVPPNAPEALAEKLYWLRDHPERAQEMGAAARERILERFTWPAVVRRCLDIYASAQ